jgi:hypothetical protein
MWYYSTREIRDRGHASSLWHKALDVLMCLCNTAKINKVETLQISFTVLQNRQESQRSRLWLSRSSVFSPFLERDGIEHAREHLCSRNSYILLLDLSLEAQRPSSENEGSERCVLTSSSGVKSFTMLKSFRISSGVLPLIMFATVLHPTSLKAAVRKRKLTSQSNGWHTEAT